MGSGRFFALVQSFRKSISAHDELLLGQQVDDQLLPMKLVASAECCYNEQIHAFGADLAVRLQQLQLQGAGGGTHLNWLLDACAATLSSHFSLLSLLLPPATPCTKAAHRADEVLSLLDVCASLKQTADDVDRQLNLLQRALHTTAQALQRTPHRSSAALLLTAARRLRRCLDNLQFLENTRSSKPLAVAHTALLLAAKRVLAQITPAAASSSDSAAAPALNNALDGTLLISLLLLASTLSSFTAPTTCRSSGAMHSACKLIARYVSTWSSKSSGSSTSSKGASVEAAWVAPLRRLQRDLKQEELSCVFLEIQRIKASAASLHDTLLTSSSLADPRRNINVGELRHSLDSLCKSSQDAQACMSELRSHLASLFQALLALRLALLPC